MHHGFVVAWVPWVFPTVGPVSFDVVDPVLVFPHLLPIVPRETEVAQDAILHCDNLRVVLNSLYRHRVVCLRRDRGVIWGLVIGEDLMCTPHGQNCHDARDYDGGGNQDAKVAKHVLAIVGVALRHWVKQGCSKTVK